MFFDPDYLNWLSTRIVEDLSLASVGERKKIVSKALTGAICHAASVVDHEDNYSKVQSMVWYRTDGWEHGGSAISWRDRAEELEKDVKCLKEKYNIAFQALLAINLREKEVDVVAFEAIQKVINVPDPNKCCDD